MTTIKKLKSFRMVRHMSRAVFVCGLAASASACVAEALPENAEGESAGAAQPASDLRGTLLAEVEIQPGHRVRMLELDPGEIVIAGSVKADEVRHVTPFLAPGEQPKSVVDMYKHMLTKAGQAVADADVPQSIRDASERARLLERTMLANPVVDRIASAPEVKAEAEVQTQVQALSGECSADEYNDNYGAEWFRREMCNKLFYNTPTTNVASWSGEFKWPDVAWVGFAFLAADFSYGARASITNYAHYSDPIFGSPSWTRKVVFKNEFFEPRMGTYWYIRSYGGSASIQGEGGSCARVHGCKMHSRGFLP
jgi:hypothetical protein